MEHRSDYVVADGAAVESATFVHEGGEYTSGGFAVDLDAGRMIAYPDGEARGECIQLKTWGGQTVAHVRMTGSYLQRGFGGLRFRMFCYSTCGDGDGFAGRHWFGRGLGKGMMLRLRAGREA